MKKQRVVAFLTYCGQAEEAMEFYVSKLQDAKIIKLIRYGKGRKCCHKNLVTFSSFI